MRKKINYQKQLREQKENQEKAHHAYYDLKAKYDTAINCLGTLACKSCSSASPKDWNHDDRMAWTATETLKSLSKRSHREFPI